MPISMIDLAGITPKTLEASVTRSAEIVKETQAQQSFGAALQNDIKKNSQQTVKLTQTENPEYRFDAKEKGNGSYYQPDKKKKQQEKKENGESRKQTPGSFDIRI